MLLGCKDQRTAGRLNVKHRWIRISGYARIYVNGQVLTGTPVRVTGAPGLTCALTGMS
jgi:hypothetical protein